MRRGFQCLGAPAEDATEFALSETPHELEAARRQHSRIAGSDAGRQPPPRDEDTPPGVEIAHLEVLDWPEEDDEATDERGKSCDEGTGPLDGVHAAARRARPNFRRIQEGAAAAAARSATATGGAAASPRRRSHRWRRSSPQRRANQLRRRNRQRHSDPRRRGNRPRRPSNLKPKLNCRRTRKALPRLSRFPAIAPADSKCRKRCGRR